MKFGKAFSVLDGPGLTALWSDVYRKIMARATDTLRRRTGAAFSVIDPTPAFSIWPRSGATKKEKS